MADLTITPLDVVGEIRTVRWQVFLSDVHGERISGHTADGSIVKSLSGVSDGTAFTLDVVPNADVVSPSPSYYTVVLGRDAVFLISKGSGAETLSEATVVDPADVDAALVLDDLADVDAPSPSNGEGLIFNSTSGNWEPGATSATVNQLDAVGDVNAPAPTDGQVLTYDSTPGEWVAADPTGGVGVTDGDKGDVTVASSGTVWTVPDLAGKQPLDSDLTAIAALTTTAYGRAFLELADAAAGRTALGLGTAATQAASAFDAAGSAAAAQAAAIAASQPLDSDLTAIAALTTTSYGRAFLALADQAALMALVAAASDTAAGKVELATTSEATTGTDTARAVTPAGVKAATDALVAGGTAVAGFGGATGDGSSIGGVLVYESGVPKIATPLQLNPSVNTAGAVMESDTSTASMSFVVDEDTMTSDSATKVPTQQSVKAYVDTHINDTSAAHAASAISYAGTTGISATDVEAAIDEVASEYARLAFGTTDQVFSNTAGRRIAIESYDSGFGDSDIRIAVYLDSDDTQPAFSIGTAVLGFASVFGFGAGGSSSIDTVLSRSRAGVLATSGSGTPNSYAYGGRLSTNITAVGNVGTGDDTLQTYTVGASQLATDKDIIRVRWFGTGANNGNAKTVRLKWNGSTIVSASLPTSVAVSWHGELVITRTGAATQDCFGTIRYNTATANAFATGAATLSGTVAIAATGDATSNNDVVSEVMTVDFEPGV